MAYTEEGPVAMQQEERRASTDRARLPGFVDTDSGPVDPDALMAQLDRVNDYVGTLSDHIDRLQVRIGKVLVPNDQPTVGRLKREGTYPELTTKVIGMADRLSEELDRVQFIIDRIDL